MAVSLEKSNLAKLMAEENILVEQRRVSTAFFDTVNRILTLPTFKEGLSNNVLDLMISHECAHAIYTSDEWREKLKSYGIRKSIFNVVEDARIERKIKYKYPGLRSIYFSGYRELYDMDFFGTSSRPIDEYNLIDKINLHYKIGFINDLHFTDEEQYFVDKLLMIQTLEEAIDLSKEIQDFMSPEEDEEDDFRDSYFDDGGDGEWIDSDSVESETDISWNNRLADLLAENVRDNCYIDVPDIDINDIIIPYTTIYERLNHYLDKDTNAGSYIKNTFIDFKNKNSSIVSYLVKEFLLKKNADGRKKSKISKTGDINPAKLYQYKISDDIFKRMAITPNAQSHGLVFFLDWSASMTPYFTQTIEQLIIMLMFCKKLRIPFEVYAFTTNYYDADKHPFISFSSLSANRSRYNENAAIIDPLDLMNIFSSKMKETEFNRACDILLSTDGTRFFRSYDKHPNWFILCGTPLNQAILVSDKVVAKFRETNKVQIVNAIYLTDGDSHLVHTKIRIPTTSFHNMEAISHTNYNVYLRNPRNGAVQRVKNNVETETDDCLRLIKQYADFKIFGFRITTRKDFKKSFGRNFGYGLYDFDSIVKKLIKDNLVQHPNPVYDEYYFLKNLDDIKDEEMGEVEEKDTISSITKKFTKSVGGRVNNRVFLKKFIEFIS